MSQIKPEDLRSAPHRYQSSRRLNDVLIGEDNGLQLINTSATGDVTTLRAMLEKSPQIALETPHRIYEEDRPQKDKDDVRGVLAMKKSNIGQAISRAAENGHAAAVSILLEFALRNGLEASTVIDRETIRRTIKNGQAAVFEALIMAAPSVATFNIAHGQRSIDLAMAVHDIEIAKLILQHGGGCEFPNPGRTSTYPKSELCRSVSSTDTTMTELLIQYGCTVKGSGALQMAAERGALDTIRLLVEEHGVDVNEQLPGETLPVFNNEVYASWYPIHYAARWGKEEAMKLLESYGARADVPDVNGKTPSQLLEERKEEMKAD